VQLGRAQQLVSATGRFVYTRERTQINLELRFHRWVIPYLVASAALLVVIGAVLSKVYADQTLGLPVLAVAALGLFGNLAFGLFQQRRLLQTLKRILDAHSLEPHATGGVG